jgi:hypothetical protein
MMHAMRSLTPLVLCLATAIGPTVPALAQGASVIRAAAGGQVSPTNYRDRLAMVFLGRRCALLQADELLAVTAFAAQSRGEMLRAGMTPAVLDGHRDIVLAGTRKRSCDDPEIVAEADRVRRTYSGWKMIMRSDLPGHARAWAMNRSGLDGWRVWQVLAGEDLAPDHVRAGLIRHTDGGIRFALEVPDASVSAIWVHLRDRSVLPVRGGAVGLTAPPRAATIQLNGSEKLPAITRPRAATDPRSGTLMVFGEAETRQIVRADPRDAFEVEIVRRDGSHSRHVVEAGDIVVGYAFAALS